MAVVHSITLIDACIIFMVLVGLWRGFVFGFVKTVTSLVAWLLALIIASYAAKQIAPFLAVFIESSVLRIVCAFLLIVFGVIAVIHLTTSMIVVALKSLKLGFLDRLLGGVLGVVIGVLKVLVILSISSPLLIHLSNWQQSILAQNLLPFAPIAMELLQESLGGAWQQIQNPYQSS